MRLATLPVVVLVCALAPGAKAAPAAPPPSQAGAEAAPPAQATTAPNASQTASPAESTADGAAATADPAQPDASAQPKAAPTGTEEAGPAKADAAPQGEPAQPQGPPKPLSALNPMFRASLAVDSVWNTDPGYDLFSENDVDPRVGLRAELDILELGSAATVGVELGFASEQTDEGASSYDMSNPKLEAAHLFAGVLPRYQLFWLLGLHAHVFGGASVNHVEIGLGDRSFEHDSVDPFVAAGAGLSLSTKPWRTSKTRTHWNSLALGAQVEGGYWLSPALEMSLSNRSADPPDQRLPVTGASLGGLDRSGPYVTVSAFLRL